MDPTNTWLAIMRHNYSCLGGDFSPHLTAYASKPLITVVLWRCYALTIMESLILSGSVGCVSVLWLQEYVSGCLYVIKVERYAFSKFRKLFYAYEASVVWKPNRKKSTSNLPKLPYFDAFDLGLERSSELVQGGKSTRTDLFDATQPLVWLDEAVLEIVSNSVNWHF